MAKPEKGLEASGSGVDNFLPARGRVLCEAGLVGSAVYLGTRGSGVDAFLPVRGRGLCEAR